MCIEADVVTKICTYAIIRYLITTIQGPVIKSGRFKTHKTDNHRMSDTGTKEPRSHNVASFLVANSAGFAYGMAQSITSGIITGVSI